MRMFSRGLSRHSRDQGLEQRGNACSNETVGHERTWLAEAIRTVLSPVLLHVCLSADSSVPQLVLRLVPLAPRPERGPPSPSSETTGGQAQDEEAQVPPLHSPQPEGHRGLGYGQRLHTPPSVLVLCCLLRSRQKRHQIKHFKPAPFASLRCRGPEEAAIVSGRAQVR